MFVIRDAKGILFTNRYSTKEEAQKLIDNKARISIYARRFWYVEEVKE